MHGFGKVGAVNVGDEAEIHVPLAVTAESLVGRGRAGVGASDADVDHGLDPLAGVAGPSSRTDAIAECGHAVENFVHLRHDVLAVVHD